jgi:cytochrome c-type biogenesis protein
MSGGTELSLWLAYGAGVLSFLSPCVLPLVPSYVAFITGLSFEELTQNDAEAGRIRRTVLFHSLLFILGFSSLFTALGASASVLGRFLADHRDLIRIAGGILVILFGLFISGVFSLAFLQREKKFHFQNKPVGYIGSFLVGVTFAAGWTPCVGPILSSILLYASTADDPRGGMILLFAYSLGLGLPFFICSLALNRFLRFFRTASRFIGVFTKVGGILLILVGLLLLTDSLNFLMELWERWFPQT